MCNVQFSIFFAKVHMIFTCFVSACMLKGKRLFLVSSFNSMISNNFDLITKTKKRKKKKKILCPHSYASSHECCCRRVAVVMAAPAETIRWLKGRVKAVPSGDTLVIIGSSKAEIPPEKTINLAHLGAPRLVIMNSSFFVVLYLHCNTCFYHCFLLSLLILYSQL